MPTISDLKDQARTLEQQGQFDRALTIYQHILKHLEGTPALAKVLPLYVKAGDLLHKMDRQEEAVDSYQAAAEHYASTGAAPRVTALCGKIIRLAPERRDVYTNFVRQLIDHGHVGSARDVLADFARYAGMDRASETLDDLAGRPNNEVQPMLERLLNSFELDDQSEQTAERVSSQLEQVTDNLAGELSGVPETTAEVEEEVVAGEEGDYDEEKDEEDSTTEEVDPAAVDEDPTADAEEEHDDPVAEEPIDDAEPLTPPMLDLDHLPRQSSMHEAIRLAGKDEDEPVDADAEASDAEEESEIEITRDVTPTMDGIQPVSDADDEIPVEDTSASFDVEKTPIEVGAAGDDELDSLLANAMATEDATETSSDADTPGAVEIEGSEWKPDFPEPKAEDTVAAEWAPEEELQPAARYPSDEYDTPDLAEESDALEDEIARAVEGFGAPATMAEEPEAPVEATEEEPPAQVEEPAFVPPTEPDAPVEPERRPSRPPQMMVPDDSGSQSKSPILFGIVGLVVGALAGAGLTFVMLGGGSGTPPTVEQTAATVDTPATRVETPAATQPEPEVAAPVTPDSAEVETPAVDTTAETPVDSAAAAEAVLVTPEEANPDSAPGAAATEQPADSVAPSGNPIIVEGLTIDEISEIEYRGLAGYRVVHLLDWGDPIVIEAYRDTTVTLSTRIQVNVTPPDTVVGIRRLDGYMVYASGVMPEDSLRSLMSRLVEGERQN